MHWALADYENLKYVQHQSRVHFLCIICILHQCITLNPYTSMYKKLIWVPIPKFLYHYQQMVPTSLLKRLLPILKPTYNGSGTFRMIIDKLGMQCIIVDLDSYKLQRFLNFLRLFIIFMSTLACCVLLSTSGFYKNT